MSNGIFMDMTPKGPLIDNKESIFLKYYKGISVINNIKSVSSPSRFIYFSFKDISYWDKISNNSFLVLSTSKKVISSVKAKHLKIGGKVLCIIN
jgi:ribosomal protein S8